MSQRPGSFVNAAGILASDNPADVVRKLDAAWAASIPAAPGIDLARALDIMWEWRTQIEGHVFDSRDVARTLTSPDLQAIGVDPMVCAGVLTRGEAVIAAKREITRALIDANPKGGSAAHKQRVKWLEVRGLAAGIVKNLKSFAEAKPNDWCGALDDSLDFADLIEKKADVQAASAEVRS